MMVGQPPPPEGFTLGEMRAGVATVGPRDGTQERKRRRLFFKSALEGWILEGGTCDLLDAENIANSPVSSLSTRLRTMALSCGPGKPPSVRELPSFNVQIDHTDPGYCYLSFVRQDAYLSCVEELGFNPGKERVIAWLFDHPSVHSSARYQVEVGGPQLSSGSYVQMHVTPVKNGLTWQEALSVGPINTRVGAAPGPTMATAMQAAEPSGLRTVLEVKPRGAGIVIPVPFGFVIQSHQGGKRVKWDPATSKSMARLTQYFESVEMLSMHIAAVVHEGGPTTLLRLAITQFNQAPETDLDWVTSPHSIMLSGNSQTGMAAELSLPANHQFGRQLKGVNLGNTSPAVHAMLTSPNASYAYCKGLIEVRVVGSGIPGAIKVGTYSKDADLGPAPSRRAAGQLAGAGGEAGPSGIVRRRISPAGTVVDASVDGTTVVESDGDEEDSDDVDD